LPYIWPKPIYESLIRLTHIRGEYDLNEMVINILKEEFRSHGLMKEVADCDHANIYHGQRFLMCQGCGMKFDSDTMVAVIQNQAKEKLRKKCKHPDWERDFEGHPLKCKVCGTDWGTAVLENPAS